MNTFFKVILTFISAIFLFSACTNKDKQDIVGKEFKLINSPSNAEITISFLPDAPRFAGKAPVNRYFGIYTMNGNEIKFFQIGTTMMMGPENLMQAETEYLQALETVESFKLKEKTLLLNGSKTLKFKEIGKIEE